MTNNKKIFLTVIVLITAVLSILTLFILPKILKGNNIVINKEQEKRRNTQPYVPEVLANDGAYTWWTNALALRYVGAYDKTYISYINSKGNMMVGSMDHSTGKKEYFALAKFEHDDHNSASLAVLPNGKILAVYARHNADKNLRWRISEKKEDIASFTDEKMVTCSALVTYIQIHKISDTEYRIFYRIGSSNWGTRIYNYINDEWTDEIVWLKETNGGQYYMWTQEAVDGTVDLFMTCHPINGRDQNIYYCNIDKEGNLCNIGGEKIANVNDKTTLPIGPRDLDVVYQAKQREKTRLFDICYMGGTKGVLFGVFTGIDDCMYQYGYYDKEENKWQIKDVTVAGIPVEDPPGKNFYFGGLVFKKGDINTLYVSREEEGIWYIEKWETEDKGNTWKTTQLDSSSEDELIRPQCPFNSHEDIDVFYVKGNYITFMNFKTDIIMIAD